MRSSSSSKKIKNMSLLFKALLKIKREDKRPNNHLKRGENNSKNKLMNKSN